MTDSRDGTPEVTATEKVAREWLEENRLSVGRNIASLTAMLDHVHAAARSEGERAGRAAGRVEEREAMIRLIESPQTVVDFCDPAAIGPLGRLRRRVVRGGHLAGEGE